MSAADENRIAQQKQLALAAGLLGGRGNFAQNFVGAMMQAQQHEMSQRNALLNNRMLSLQYRDRQRKADEDASARQVLQNFKMPTQHQAAMALMPSLSPTQANASMVDAITPLQPTDQGRMGTYNRLLAQAKQLEQAGLMERANTYYQTAEKYRPQLDSVKTLTDKGGQRQAVAVYKDGTTEPLPYGPDQEKLHFADNGQATGIGLDPFTGSVRAAGIQKQMSPDAAASNALGWANYNKPQLTEANGGMVWASPPTRGNAGAVTPLVTAAGAPVMGPKTREDLDGLRKEFAALPAVKNYGEVVPLIEGARSAPDTPQGDFALIYGVGKVLDPGSVVREGEMNLVIKSGSPAQQVQGYLNQLRGRGRLTPEMRTNLLQVLDQRGGEYLKQYDAARQTYSQIANSRGYPSDQLFVEPPKLNRPSARMVNATTVQLPDGKQMTFPSTAAAQAFKKQAGLE